MKKLLLAIATAALPFAMEAQSSDSAPKNTSAKNGEEQSEKIAEIFSQMDPATRIQLMKGFDKDGDGRLNQKERAEAVKSMKEKIVDLEQMRLKHSESIIKKFDKDGDGKLDVKELDAFLEEQLKIFAQAREGGRRMRNIPADILNKYDKDGDGKLSSSERRQMHQDMANRRNALIKKYDKDGDGKLSDAEKEQLINDPEVRNVMKRMIGNPPPPPPRD